MPSDPHEAERYRKAWLQLAESVESFEAQFEPAIFGDSDAGLLMVPEPEGVPIMDDPLGKEIADTIDKYGPALIEKFPGTQGVALSLRYREGRIFPDEPCLTFFVDDKARERNIPTTFQGLPTDVIEAGVANLHAPHRPGSRLRPAAPGCSISHFRITSGTLGCLVKDTNGVLYILSCAHVLSDAAAAPKDPVVQQGMKFGGSPPRDCIATFARSIPLHSGDCIADAALAEVTDPGAVINVIRYIGATPRQTRTISAVGVSVQKSGDETGHTTGVVIGLNGLVGQFNINGVPGVSFKNTIITNGMSEPGDSGALLLDNQENVIGLLFGGQESVDPVSKKKEYIASWYTPIDTILQNLDVEFA